MIRRRAPPRVRVLPSDVGSDADHSITETDATMACPYLREVVMLSCDAFPVKKMLPLDRLATGNPCLGEFHVCPFFEECTARTRTIAGEHAAAVSRVGKDGSQ